ncbi:Polyketide synthase modules and related proteins, partial [hydrothermal vent metagenome]
RYRPDPFLGDGRFMFRTRDLGRWTSEGELEHYGRTDDQVKVRGFRVELDSVSAALESTPNCKRAVTLKLNSHDLVGFVSPRAVDTEAALKAVADHLPYYCTPKFVIDLEALPMTPRGKIDKRLLLEMAKAYDNIQENGHYLK